MVDDFPPVRTLKGFNILIVLLNEYWIFGKMNFFYVKPLWGWEQRQSFNHRFHLWLLLLNYFVVNSILIELFSMKHRFYCCSFTAPVLCRMSSVHQLHQHFPTATQLNNNSHRWNLWLANTPQTEPWKGSTFLIQPIEWIIAIMEMLCIGYICRNNRTKL